MGILPFYLFAALLCCGGATAVAVYLPDGGPATNNCFATEMLVLASLALILAIHCVGTFKGFAANFARTVYQDFSTVAPPPTAQDIRHRAQRICTIQGHGEYWDYWDMATQQLRG